MKGGRTMTSAASFWLLLTFSLLNFSEACYLESICLTRIKSSKAKRLAHVVITGCAIMGIAVIGIRVTNYLLSSICMPIIPAIVCGGLTSEAIYIPCHAGIHLCFDE